MTNYHFETKEFGISDTGIHLLRSRFNYETIEFTQLESLRVEKGKELNNWVVVLIIGLALVSFGVYYCLRMYDILDTGAVRVVNIEELLVPLLPLLMGGYCVYSSTRNGIILRVRTVKGKAEKFPLKELEEDDKLNALKDFLKGKLTARATYI